MDVDVDVVVVDEANAFNYFAVFVRDNPGQPVRIEFPTFKLEYIPIPENPEITGIVLTGRIINWDDLSEEFKAQFEESSNGNQSG